MEKAKAFPLSTHVNVKLIGWDGKGRYGVRVDEARLAAAFKELHSDLPVTTVQPESGEGAALHITDKFYFSVEHAGGKLTQALNAAVGGSLGAARATAKATAAGKEKAGGKMRVPRAVVDELLTADFEETAL